MKNIFLPLLLTLFSALHLLANTTYRINIQVPEKEILRGHLQLGGENHLGNKITVNSHYIEWDGEPFFPVVGEFHYARYPQSYWEESILKMKAGGIKVIASYVFWNIHERKEGEVDWTGDLNLRKFLQLIAKHDLFAIVRIGPFCHGEIRNGGIPDWLYGRPFEIRSNDSEYLYFVDKWYAEIGKQVQGLLFKDGGPVIGVQLENEYQHSHAPWEWSYPGATREFTVSHRDAALSHEQIAISEVKNPWAEYGQRHMATLKQMAKKHGMDVPLYTATGWGNATIVEKGSLPVTAGYAYPFWRRPEPSPFYLFKDIRKIPDYSPVSYDTRWYPSIPAEIGPGIQVKHSRRPFVPHESVKPLMVRILGSGSNGIGYYMYHGGSTPVFDGKFYNEEVNGLPRINYDYQAPIGQYGQTRLHYQQLRMLHMFLDAWGEKLAPMKSVLPETNAHIVPGNTETLRYAVRSYGNQGFVFIINFQDHVDIQNINQVNIKVDAANETLTFPFHGNFNIAKGISAILPFNLTMDRALLKTATVQPLTQLKRKEGNYFVFSSIPGIEPELVFPRATRISKLNNAKVQTVGQMKRVSSLSNKPFSFSANGTTILVLPNEMAINALKIDEKLVISEALILDDLKAWRVISQSVDNTLHVFPQTNVLPTVSSATLRAVKAPFRDFSSYTISFKEVKPEFTLERISDQKYQFKLHTDLSQLNDLMLEIDYVGDRALAFIEGEMITDHFFHDRTWEIGLRAFAGKLKHHPMLLFFHPIRSTYSYLGDIKSPLKFVGGRHLSVNHFKFIPEYATMLQW